MEAPFSLARYVIKTLPGRMKRNINDRFHATLDSAAFLGNWERIGSTEIIQREYFYIGVERDEKFRKNFPEAKPSSGRRRWFYLLIILWVQRERLMYLTETGSLLRQIDVKSGCGIDVRKSFFFSLCRRLHDIYVFIVKEVK